LERQFFTVDFPLSNEPFDNFNFYVKSVAIEVDVDVIDDPEEDFYIENFSGPFDDLDFDDFFLETFFFFFLIFFFFLPHIFFFCSFWFFYLFFFFF
jgi:hypothetical protein